MSEELEDLCHEEMLRKDGPVTRKLKEQAKRIKQLEERVEELESSTECACAYDRPTDICAFHYKLFEKVTTIRRDRIEQLEAVLRDIAMRCDAKRLPGCDRGTQWAADTARAALEGKKDG